MRDLEAFSKKENAERKAETENINKILNAENDKRMKEAQALKDKMEKEKKELQAYLEQVWPWIVKFIYSEKATKVCEIFTLLLSYVGPVKSKVNISQKFVAFSEYMNFNSPTGSISSPLRIIRKLEPICSNWVSW